MEQVSTVDEVKSVLEQQDGKIEVDEIYRESVEEKDGKIETVDEMVLRVVAKDGKVEVDEVIVREEKFTGRKEVIDGKYVGEKFMLPEVGA